MTRTAILASACFWILIAPSTALAQDPSESDRMTMGANFQSTLENNPTNQASTWVNPDTGNSGSAVPVKTFENAYGQPCREFTQTITIGGRQEEGYGTACRQPDGSWQIVDPTRSATVASPAGGRVYTSQTRVYNQYYTEPAQVTYVPAAPVRYYDPWYGYPYPYPAYYGWGWPFSFSYSYVKYSGGGHGHNHGHYKGYKGYGGHGGNWGYKGYKGGHGGKNWGSGWNKGGGRGNRGGDWGHGGRGGGSGWSKGGGNRGGDWGRGGGGRSSRR